MSSELDLLIREALNRRSEEIPANADLPGVTRLEASALPQRHHAAGRAFAGRWLPVAAAAFFVIGLVATLVVMSNRNDEQDLHARGLERTYPLPHQGGNEQQSPSLSQAATAAAGYSGRFHARLVSGGACAWLGDEPKYTVYWPDRYSVRFGDTTELVGPNGKVVASEGELVRTAGAVVDAKQGVNGCSGKDRSGFAIGRIEHVQK